MTGNAPGVENVQAGRPILAVIKNNGYGLGLVNAANALELAPSIFGFAVVKLHEAMTLRDAGVRKPILLMGPLDERNLVGTISRNIMPMIYTPLRTTLERIAARRQKSVCLHICVDTGIGRVGVPYREASPLIRDLAGSRSVQICGTIMTFTEDDQFDKEQLRRFQQLCGNLEGEGVRLGRKHAVSSYGLFQHPDAFLDMVRPGMALYGIYSEPGFRPMGLMDLRPALSLKARVAYVKQLKVGNSAGYNRAYITQRGVAATKTLTAEPNPLLHRTQILRAAQRFRWLVAQQDVWVATIPVGHADGIPRAAAKRARVRIGDTFYPIVASISASHSIVEIGAERRVNMGDVVTIFDSQEGSRPEDFGSSCATSVYDLTMHLNCLLPRRVM